MTALTLASHVVAGLISRGCRAIVVCPGSRNSPLTLAAVSAHERGEIDVHVRIDERTASFLALGIAKASGQPAAVLTTSGTAVGHLMAAVMEAHHSRIPLIALTADRPAAMRGTGANQTTWQPGIYGSFAPTLTVTDAVEDPGTAVAAALTGAGPLHINVELDEPLTGAVPQPAPVNAAPLARVTTSPTPWSDTDGAIVLAGDGTPTSGAAAVRCARDSHLPLIAEPSSWARTTPAASCGTLLLETALTDDVRTVIVFGRPTLTRAQRSLLCERDVVAVGGSPTERYPGTIAAVDAIAAAPAPPAWHRRWTDADARATEAVDRVLADAPFSGWHLARLVAQATHGAWVLGSSRLIRDADLCPVSGRLVPTYANRGLAGIDGVLATAMGVALAGTVTTALVGDLTAIHDLTSLVVPRHETGGRLRIVVGNDDGGAIFSTLEQGTLPPADLERWWTVPHGQSVADVAAAVGIRAQRTTDPATTQRMLAEPITGLEVVEVMIDAQARRRTTHILREQVRQTVG